MRGHYEAVYAISALAAARTLMYVTAPSTKVVEIQEVTVGNTNNETNEQLEICLQRVSSLGTPTATTVTPSPLETGDQAAASTVKANVTASEPTYASNTQVGYRGVPSLAGYEFVPDQNRRPVITAGETWGLRLLAAPASVNLVVRIVFREIG